MGAFAGPGFGPGINRPTAARGGQRTISGRSKQKRTYQVGFVADIYPALESVFSGDFHLDYVIPVEFAVGAFGVGYERAEFATTLVARLKYRHKR